jgi:hypothetical protein
MCIIIPVILVGNPQGKRQRGRILFKRISDKWNMTVKTGFNEAEEGSMTEFANK